MNSSENSLLKYVEIIKRKAPEYLDLLTADNQKDFEIAFDSVLEKAVTHL